MAIAFDTTSQKTASGWTSGSPVTWSHTCSGSNRLLVVCFAVGDSGSDIVSGVTYNGVAMTRVRFATYATGTRANYMYYLVAPATGANNITVTHSGSSFCHGNAVSYTGASQTGQPDSSNNGSANTATSLGVATTVVAANSWVVGIFTNSSANTNSHTNITARSDNPTIGIDIGDSNGAVAAGSYTMTEGGSGTGNWGAIVASFSPAATVNSGFLAFM